MGIPNQLELKYVKDMHPCNLHFNNKMLWEALFWRRLAPQSLLTQMYKHSPRPPLQVLGCDRNGAVQTLCPLEQIEKLNHFQQELLCLSHATKMSAVGNRSHSWRMRSLAMKANSMKISSWGLSFCGMLKCPVRWCYLSAVMYSFPDKPL